MKGATPVPGPTITKGTDRSAGGRKVQLGLKLTWTWGGAGERPLRSKIPPKIITMRAITTMLRGHRGSVDLLIDLLNIPRHANKETQGLRQESAEYISERIYGI